MPTRAELTAQHATRVTAAVAFWIAAVLFVADVSLLSGWLLSHPAAAEPAPVAAPTPPPAASPFPASPLDPAAGSGDLTLDGGATLTFPAPATPSSQIVEVGGEDVELSLHTLSASDQTTYSIGIIDYPDAVDLGDPAVNLLASVSGAAGTIAGRVVKQDVVVFQGAPAVEFEVETPTARLLARNVLDGRRLYSQTVAYTGDSKPAEAAAFFDSFTLGGR